MPTPKIKLHLLPPGYSEDQDQDIQKEDRSELVPVVDKSQLLEDVNDLDPVTAVRNEPLTPVDYDSGPSVSALQESPPDSGYFLPSSHPFATPPFINPQTEEFVVEPGAVWWVEGFLRPVVLNQDDAEVDRSNYQLSEQGVRFSDQYDSSSQHSLQYRIVQTDASARTTWAMVGDQPYRGSNNSWNRIVLQDSDDYPYEATPEVVNTAEGDREPIIRLGSAQERLIGTYAVLAERSRTWIGPHNNWVVGHYNMNPDVFVGEEDYAGDQFVDQAEIPQEPGFVPRYREPDGYRLNARDGLVTFPDLVDPSSQEVQVPNLGGQPVKANYAHLTGVELVEGMPLTYQGVEGGRHAYRQQLPLGPDTLVQSLNRGQGVSGSLIIRSRDGADHDDDVDTPDQQITYTVHASGTDTVSDLATRIMVATDSKVQLVIVGEGFRLENHELVDHFPFSVEGQAAADLGLSVAAVNNQQIDGTKVNFPEVAFTNSTGKRMVGRSDATNPRNTYVGGSLAPMITRRTQPDVLSVRTS